MSLALHEHAFLLEHDGYGAEEYLGVEGEAYVVDVVDVECEALVPRERVSAVCGGVAGDAGLDEKLLALVSLVETRFRALGGARPMMLMLPMTTFRNCGISSKLVLRKNAPTLVMRGSCGYYVAFS